MEVIEDQDWKEDGVEVPERDEEEMRRLLLTSGIGDDDDGDFTFFSGLPLERLSRRLRNLLIPLILRTCPAEA